METSLFTTTILKASEGFYITQSSDDVELRHRIFASTVALGCNDSADNYKEITKEEGDILKKEQDELIKKEMEDERLKHEAEMNMRHNAEEVVAEEVK